MIDFKRADVSTMERTHRGAPLKQNISTAGEAAYLRADARRLKDELQGQKFSLDWLDHIYKHE